MSDEQAPAGTGRAGGCPCPFCDAPGDRPYPFCQACGRKLNYCKICGKPHAGSGDVCEECRG